METVIEEPPPFKPFKEQRISYRKAKARLNIWHGPVRSGKTVGSINPWIKFIGTAPPGILIMTGKTNATLYRNVIKVMEEFLGDEMWYGMSEDSRLVRLWGREIFCFGANDERAEQKIRGLTVAGAYGDEVTLWPESYFSMMLSRMSVPGAKAFLTTNADHPMHWLKEHYLDRIDDLDMLDFTWPIDANTTLDPDFLRNIKKEYVGLWYRRFIMGEWCIAEGAVYDFFDEKIHTGRRFPNPVYYLASIDYGTNNPFTFGLYGVNREAIPKVWLIDEYYWNSKKKGRQKTDSEYSQDIKEFLDKKKIKPRKIYIDPSAASFELQLNRDGFYGVIHADNDVLPGIRTMSQMLKNGEYMWNRRCTNTTTEAYSYSWDEKASAKAGEDKVIKLHDHCMDRDRYMLHSEFGQDQLDYSRFNKV